MELIYTAELPAQADIYSLYSRLGWIDYLKLSPEQVLTAMKQSWYSLYVYSGDELIATGRVVSDGIMNAYLCGLGVDPDYRKRGIGTEISRRLVEHCKDNNLHIQFFCREGLIPYYEKMGFEQFAAGMRVRENVQE